MKKNVLSCFLLLFLVSMVNADIALTSLIGDKDGFGLGITNGQTFYADHIGSGDGDGTDVWMWGDKSWTHVFDLSLLEGPIASASLELFHGGDGLYSPSNVYVNNVFVGTLTDAEPGRNVACLDILDLTPYTSIIASSNKLDILVSYSGDGWVLDYSELNVNSGAVPAPGAAMLGMIGLTLIPILKRRFGRRAA